MSFWNTVNPANWLGPGTNQKMDNTGFATQKSNLLLSQICIVVMLTVVLHSLRDLIRGSYATALIDFFIFLLFLSIYQANRKGKHDVARLIFLILTNASLFIMANILPKERGIYLIFFPIMLLGIALGDERKVLRRFIFPMISITLLITLEFTNYQVFGDINVNKGDVDKSFLINLISSATLLVLTAAFLIRNNQRAERILKDNQEKLRNMADEIEQKNEVLSKTNAELDRFVYSTSHDLRSPLMSILGLINVAKYEKSSAELKKYFEKIQDRVNSLNNFIADILDYSKNTRQEVAPELVDIEKMIINIVEDHKYLDGAEKVDIKINCNLDGPVTIDANRVSVILKNLVSNSFKYYNRELKHPEITFNANTLNGSLLLHINDNGYGIREEDQERIFEMFYRASEYSTGSGLGLYIVKEMVDKLNGSIKLQSVHGESTDFTVSLPLSKIS